MRRLFLSLLLATAAAACSNATGPKPLPDPFVVVRVVNDLDTSYAIYTRSTQDTIKTFHGVLDARAPTDTAPSSECISFGSIADTTHVYFDAFRSNPGASNGIYSAGDSTQLHATGVTDPFVGQPGHGAVAADPLRWLWVLSADSLAPDTSQACRY